jgi:hypothetical protein
LQDILTKKDLLPLFQKKVKRYRYELRRIGKKVAVHGLKLVGAQRRSRL